MVLWMNPEHHQGLPLSLVKDKIEQSTKRSLSEHLLGFSKLSHLFAITELEGCCELRHDEPFQPVLCPPSLVMSNGVLKPGKAAVKGSTPAANEVVKTSAPMSDEAELAWAQRPPPNPMDLFSGAAGPAMALGPTPFPPLPPLLAAQLQQMPPGLR
jgi:hypothetical protein